MSKPGVSLILRIGHWGERTEQVEVPIGEKLMRELMEPVEYSDDEFTGLIHAMTRKESVVKTRKRVFKMRRSVADEIGRAIANHLVKQLGDHDTLDGYDIKGMSEEERQYHRMRGRLRD